MDVVIHQSVAPKRGYELYIFDTVPHGHVDITRPSDYPNQMRHSEAIEELGDGIDRLNVAQLPRYQEMVSTVMRRMGWNPAEFKCYRCQIDYPVYGSQISLIQTPYPPGI